MAWTFHAFGSELQVQVHQRGTPAMSWVYTPPLAIRQDIKLDALSATGHAGATNLLGTLRVTYWWPGMAMDIQHATAECLNCQR